LAAHQAVGMSYTEYKPESRDEFQSAWRNAISMKKALQTPLSILAAPPGSGKTKIIFETADMWYQMYPKYCCVFLAVSNERLCKQFMIDAPDGVELINMEDSFLYQKNPKLIQYSIAQGKRVIICGTNLGHHLGRFTKQTRQIIEILECLPSNFKKLFIVDEVDSQITHLTGGQCASYIHNNSYVKKYLKIRAQEMRPLNLFARLRSIANVNTLITSGTLNNTVSSKLTSLGYAYDDVSCHNFYPIASLYNGIAHVCTDIDDLNYLGPILRTIEEKGQHILLVFPDINSRKKFEISYCDYFNKQIQWTIIDSSDESDTPAKGKLRTYIASVNMLIKGFNFSSWISSDTQLGGIVIFRQFSDKGSQPLSNNAEHSLHHDISANLIQVILRCREKGGTVVTSHRDKIDIVTELTKISDIIGEGFKKYFSFFGQYVPTTPTAVWAISTLIAIVQNQKSTNDKNMADVRYELSKITGRDDCEIVFKTWANSKTSNLHTIEELLFWIGAVRIMWKRFAQVFESNENYLAAINAFRHKWSLRAGAPRLINEEIAVFVKNKAKDICMHCGDRIVRGDQGQIAHIDRADQGGQYLPENLGWAHRDCDASLDTLRFMYGHDGSYILIEPTLSRTKVDIKQIRCISASNYKKRWEWQAKQWAVPADNLKDFAEKKLGYKIIAYL